MCKLGTFDWIALLLVVIAGLTWGSVALLDFNAIAYIFGAGTTLAKIVYSLMGLAALYVLYMALGKRSESSKH